MKPQIFGKYCLLDRISVGGMAEVFRARPFNDRGYTGFLALKRILPHLAEDQEFIKMFIDEAALTTRLHHRNIVRVHELATYKDSNFILMEYICGRDILAIQKAMRRRREICPVEFAVMVISDVVRGLDFAHRATDEQGRNLNIVHRDVSPQNILIQYDGIAKVIDFGIAKARVKSTKTRVGVVKGKVGYMSPEQVRSEPLNGQSDLFSVGVVFWELVTNKRLFKGANEFDSMNMVREAIVKPPSTLNSVIPPEIDRIILKALAPNLEDRYATGAEMVADLEKWLQTRPTSRSRFARWMQQIFESDVEEERERIERFKGIQTPNDVLEYNKALNAKRTQRKELATDPQVNAFVGGLSPEEQVPPTDLAIPYPEDTEHGQELSDAGGPTDMTPRQEAFGGDDPLEGQVTDNEPIDAAAYMAFAEEQTQIRAGGFSFDDLSEPNPESKLSFSTPSEPVFSPSPPQPITPVEAAHPPQFESDSLPSFKVLGIGFLALLLVGVGVAVAAAMLTDQPDAASPHTGLRYASVILNITPPQGIRVTLDGSPMGNVSPVTIDTVPAGKHKLVVRAEGYNAYTEELDIPATGIVEKRVALTIKREALSMVRVDVGKLGSSAQIYLDGDPKSPLSASAGLEVMPGQHVLEITENGKSSYSELLDIEPSSTITLTPILYSFERRIIFPPGLTASVNGEQVSGPSHILDTSQPVLITLQQGPQTLFSGYVGYPELAVERFNPETTPKNLTKEDFGWLAVDTQRDWWMLSLDDVPLGLSSPIPTDQPIPIRKGSHTLSLQRAGAKKEFAFNAQPGGTVFFDRPVLLTTEYSETE